jgi:hypothetical protein
VQRIEKILLGYFHSESTNADDIRSLSLSIHAQIVGEVLYYFTTENTGYKSSVIEEIYTRILKVLTNSRPLN